ncbi:hypothetical protein T261_05434 [Streptomyces lydicus]|nr:hypothetical protein T261_05434 [Streptomyces lydicus]
MRFRRSHIATSILAGMRLGQALNSPVRLSRHHREFARATAMPVPEFVTAR